MAAAWAVVVISGVGPGTSWAQDAGPSDAARSDAARSDAGPPDAGAAFAPAQGGVDPIAAAADSSALSAVRLRVRRLQEAASEAAELDVPLASLFAIDLRDEASIETRLEELDRLVQAVDRDAPDLVRVDTASTSTVVVPPTLLRAALDREALSAERAFLRLPIEVRTGRMEADLARRSHERERQQAFERARAAEADAKAAEAARIKALQEAERAKSEAIKALKNRLASVARAKSQLADKSQNLAERHEAESKKNAEALHRVQDLLQRESEAEDGPAAYALFGEIGADLRTSVEVLRTTLAELDEGLVVPDLRSGAPRPTRAPSDEEREAARELQEALRQIDAYAEEVEAQRRAFRLKSVSAAYRRVQALADARVRLLARMPPDSRAELQGLSKLGLGEARLETELLALGTRAQPILHTATFKRAPKAFEDIATLGKTFWVLTRIAVVILLGLWLRRRGGAIARWFDRVVRPRIRSVVGLRRYAFAKRTLTSFGPSLLFLASIHIVYRILGPWGQIAMVDLLFTTVLWVTYYWLLRTWLGATILWLAKKRHIALDPTLEARLHRSTQLVARTVLVFGLLDSVAVQVLRRGVLFRFANFVLLFGAVVVLLVVVRWWRRDITAAYLNKWPSGTLADLVRSTSEKFYNIFVVFAALGYVLVSGVAVFAKQFVLGFEQSRKALAFVFRKRLERRSDKLRSAGSRLEELPTALLDAFTSEALTTARLRIQHFPGAEKLRRDVAAWAEGKCKGSFALIGGSGYGKTTWLHHALGEATVPTRYLELERRDASAQALLDQVGAALGLDQGVGYDDVVAAIRGGEKTLWALDGAHHLFFRTMDGCEGIDALMRLIEDTGRDVFWLCAFDRLAWRHILAYRPARIRFRAEQQLGPWPEQQLRELLMARVGDSGVAHEFEDLVVAGETGKEEALVEASEGYTRLIWDYSDGCPRVALRFWLHSLVPVSDRRVRVRLFEEPDEESLGNVPEEAVFIYAAVANHGALSPRETAEIVGLPEPLCEAGLVRAVEAGYFTEAAGRFCLTVDWQRQMIRFLRNRQAL